MRDNNMRDNNSWIFWAVFFSLVIGLTLLFAGCPAKPSPRQRKSQKAGRDNGAAPNAPAKNTARPLGFAKELPQFQRIADTPISARVGGKPVVYRGPHTFYMNPGPGNRLDVTLTVRQIGKNPLPTYTLSSPDDKVLMSGSFPASGKQHLRHTALTQGTFRLRVGSTANAYIVRFNDMPYVVATPLHTFNCKSTLFFFVPETTSRFRILLRGGGLREQAAIKVYAANGRLVSQDQTSGKAAALVMQVEVPDGQDGKIWRVAISKPTQGVLEDVYLAFDNAIPPWVSTSPARLMREKIFTFGEMQARYKPILDRLSARLRAIPANRADITYWRQNLKTQLVTTRKSLPKLRGFSQQAKVQAAMVAMDQTITALAAGQIKTKRCIVFQTKAVSNNRILPTTKPVNGIITSTITCIATPGEYEPASFVIRAQEKLSRLRFDIPELRSANGSSIPARSLDLRVVKCWYQDQGRNFSEETPTKRFNPISLSGKRVLVPELLLKDDSLVRVDSQNKDNFLKLRFASGDRYVCISKPDGMTQWTADEFPVRDSDTLQPVDIPANTNKQFLLTIHIPQSAKPGLYQGRMRVLDEKDEIGVLNLQCRVLPFKLQQAMIFSSMYYYAPNRKFYGKATMAQFRREMINMREHGLMDVMSPFNISNQEAYAIRRELGLNRKVIFYRGYLPRNPTTPEALQAIEDTVRKTMAFFREQGTEEVYFYGLDEVRGDELTSQRPAWKAVHKGGGKIFVSGYITTPGKPGNLDLMGDLQDALVLNGYPLKQEAARWHKRKHLIVNYGNPQGGVELPDTYRRNFGLLLWQSDFDGAMTYIYHWGAMQSTGKKPNRKRRGLPNAWNDFSRGDNYKQHNMVYPTTNGVIDTLQWEGYREGVDDLRYLATLLRAIKKAGSSPARRAATALGRAKAFVHDLKNTDVNVTRADMDELRLQIISHLLALHKETE